MRKLLYIFVFCALLMGCEHIRKTYYDNKETIDSITYEQYIDESPIDTEVIDKIYNANTMDEIFPE